MRAIRRFFRKIKSWFTGGDPEPQPQPNPNPQPPQPPPPPPPPDTDIGLPAGTQWIYGRNIADWPQTINLSAVTVHYNVHKVTVTYDRLQQIPAWNVPGDPNNVTNVNGSIWLIRQFEGQWYIGTFEYLRVGQQTKEFLWQGVSQWKFAPQPGDRIGFMVSTMARGREDGTINAGVTYRERSNILWLPGDWNPR